MKALGLMSGTSLDGIDAAIIDTDGTVVEAIGPAATYPYPQELQERIMRVIQGKGNIAAVEHALTLAHVDAVQQLLAAHGLNPRDIDVIGFHGQTILHRPHEGITWQLGNGSLLAERTQIDVVYDFRRRDVAAGGQGAPLVPLFHAALAHNYPHPIAFVNIGGVANITWIGNYGEDDLVAFDTGPGNALINDWMLCQSWAQYDRDGETASAGTVNEDILHHLLSHPYFNQAPPKSLDRNSFSIGALDGLSLENGAATLTAFTAHSIANAVKHVPKAPNQWFITGGGRHNKTLMTMLSTLIDAPVQDVDTIEHQGDAIEAQAFAFLAVRTLKGLPLTLPHTTGAPRPLPGGVVCRA